MPYLNIQSSIPINKDLLLELRDNIALYFKIDNKLVWISCQETVFLDKKDYMVFHFSWSHTRPSSISQVRNLFKDQLEKFGYTLGQCLLFFNPVPTSFIASPYVNFKHTFEWTPIGYVENNIEKKRDDKWGEVESKIHIDKDFYSEKALHGLKSFSHIDVYFYFDQKSKKREQIKEIRHPKGREDLPKVGILAQRAKNRWNFLGHSTCHIVNIEGASITVRGLDAFNRTPVIDIKPHFKNNINDIHEAPWVNKIMKYYWKTE